MKIVWGLHAGIVYIGELTHLTRIADERQTLNRIAFGTWAEALNGEGRDHLEDLFGAILDELWDQAELEHDSSIGERPRDWIPEATINPNDDLWSHYGVIDEVDPQLPEQFFEFGSGGGNMVRGDWWNWGLGDIGSLRQVANNLGLEFEENQDLIDRCFR